MIFRRCMIKKCKSKLIDKHIKKSINLLLFVIKILFCLTSWKYIYESVLIFVLFNLYLYFFILYY